jgi:phosphoribosylanthranilate isomerase
MANTTHFHDFIQVAGVSDRDEATLLTECGIRYLGFPLRLPVNKEDLTEPAAAAIIRGLRPPLYGVAITYQRIADEIVEFMDYLGAFIVQLHGDIAVAELARLRRLRPGLTVIKSLVIGERPFQELVETVPRLDAYVDAYITDTFDSATGASGATGKRHDWRLSRKLVETAAKPVILAGGLTPENVREAIAGVAPAGVDVHTGVEDASGRKDPAKLRRFVVEARAGFELLRADRHAKVRPGTGRSDH